MKTHILQKNQYGRDKWIYRVIDSEGNTVAQRISKRDYVAATINGKFFFGRFNLIHYGDHGRAERYADKMLGATTGGYVAECSESRKWARKNGYDPDEYVKRLKERMGTPEEWVERQHAAGRELKEGLKIAYLPN